MGFVFVGGNLALDFVGTLNERNRNRVENLNEPADLAEWLVQAGVLDAAPVLQASDLAAGRQLREALYRLVRGLINHEDLRPADLRTVNRFAAAPPPIVRVTPSGRRRRTGDCPSALSAVARDGLELFDRTDDAALKWCADDDCTHPYLDHSRGHRRRWCDMGTCGDRAKAAAYRARQST